MNHLKSFLICVTMQIVLFGLFFIPIPESRLYIAPWELAYLFPWALLAISLKRKGLDWKTWRRPWLLALIIPQAFFVLIFYHTINKVHAEADPGTLSVVSFALTVLPLALWGLISLCVWSYRHFQDPLSRKALWPSLISWVLFALAYPPLPLGFAATVLLVPWLLVLMKAPVSRALFATFWSGIVFHWIMYFWIFNVAKVGPPVAIIAGLFLLIGYFTFFHVAGAWAFVHLKDRFIKKFPLVLLFPFAWAGIEVLRSWGEISFPWGHLGYVFGNHTALLQGLPWVGVFGYSIIILFANMALAYALLQWSSTHSYKRRFLALTPAFCMLVLLLWGHLRLHDADLKESTSEEELKIALIQPSISQTRKWSKAYFDSVMTKTWSILDTLDTRDLDLVVLPETALPDFLPSHPYQRSLFKRYARRHHVTIIFGALNYDTKAQPPRKFRFYNAAFIIDPEGKQQEYRKIRLVPFSEHLPFDGLIPVINYVDLGEGDFTPGKEFPLLGSQQWTPTICYENIYPDFTRQMVHAGTRLIVNITNDGWFGRTTAPGQHANIVRYRSVETGLPIARCANSGISLFYDGLGRILQKTELYEEKAIIDRLTVRSQKTFYDDWGDWLERLWVMIGMLSVLLIVLKRFAHK